MIEWQNISLSYQNEMIFENINLTIQQGEYVLILGANGSGKSTLLKCMLGLVQPQAGKVLIDGTPLPKFTKWNKIGYVSQRAAHIDMSVPVSVYEVLHMAQQVKTTKADVIKQLEVVDMLEYMYHDINKLSGGQQQRVFIARTLLSSPEILILDEPTVGLDIASISSFYQLIAKLHQEGKTIMMITHDVHLLTKEATRVIEIQRGVRFDGTKEAYRIWHNQTCEYCDFGGKDEMINGT